jgi:predicted DNA-binding transcriptional regulator YafY
LRDKFSFLGAAAGYTFAPKESGAGPKARSCAILETPAPIKNSSPSAEANLAILLESVSTHRVCEVSYESRESGSVKTYEIHPLAVFESDGGMYCFVVVAYYGSIRILALERIRELKSRPEIFTPPPDFDAARRLADPFGMVQDDPFPVRLLFSEDQAPYVRDRVWPESYCFEDLPDERLAMSFETGGLFGLKRWLLSWGADVEIVEPEWLREEFLGELEKTIGQYRR